MCTRYYMELSPELRPIIEAARISGLTSKMVDKLGKPLKTEGEIRPTDMVPAIAPDKNGRYSIFPMVWGYRLPGLDRPVVNARIETAPQKEIWKEGWNSHRCIIPASYYFEWEHHKTASGKTRAGDRYAIQPRGSDTTWLAGLYRIETYRGLSFPVFAILTRIPTEELSAIHDRMPLILPKGMVEEWIKPDSAPEEIIKTALSDMIIEKSCVHQNELTIPG